MPIYQSDGKKTLAGDITGFADRYLHLLSRNQWWWWSSLGSPRELGKTWEQAGNLNPADEQAGINEWCCGYVQGQTAIYGIWWLCILHCHMQPPSSKRRPHYTASLQVYEGAKSERNCPGNRGGSVVKWEMNVLKDWSKGILQIPKTGTNCLWQRWTGPAGCEGGSDLTVAQSDCVGCAEVGISPCGTLMTGLDGPIPCGCQTVSKTRTGGSVWVGGDSSVTHSGRIMLLQVWQADCIYFFDFFRNVLEFLDFIGKMLCGCCWWVYPSDTVL